MTGRELRKVYVFGFCWMGMLLMPVLVPLLVARGITAGQVVTLQAVYSLAFVLGEVPTGYLCDRFGRKRTLVAGATLNTVGFALFAAAQGFAALAGAEVILAAGWTLVSGADIALIYDLLDETSADRSQRRGALASYQFAQVLGEASAAMAGGVLASWSLPWVAWASAAFSAVPLGIALTFRGRPAPVRRPSPAGADLLLATRLVVHPRHRRLVLSNMVVWGLSTFVAVWLLQPYWAEQGVALGWFGLLWAGTLLTVGVVAKSAHRVERRLGSRGVLLAISACPVLAYFGMALLGGAAGVSCGFLFYVSRGLNSVYLREAFNNGLPARLRATCNSIASGVFRLVFALCGPAVGAVVDRAGLTAALAALGGVFLLALFLVAVPLWREVPPFEQAVTPWRG